MILKTLKWFGGILLSLVFIITLLLYIYKDEICGIVVNTINKHLTAEIKVNKVDLSFWGSFPNLSVDFENVFIQDPRDGKTERDTLLYSERIRLKFNPMDIWNEDYTLKSIEVNPGSLSIDVDSNGVSNYDIFIAQNDSVQKEDFSMNLQHVEFLDFRFNYTNHISSQTYQTQINTMELSGAFNSAKFSSMANCDMTIVSARSGKVKLISNQPARLNIQLNFDKDSSSMVIPESTIYISELPFKFKGFLNKDEFHFNLNGNDLNIHEVAEKLAFRESENVQKLQGKGKLLFDLNFDKVFDKQEVMSVNCDFGVDNGTLIEPTKNVQISALHIKGKYQNEQHRIQENLSLEEVSFRTNAGKISGNLKITQFSNPRYKGRTNGKVNLKVIHQLFPNAFIDQISGNLAIDAAFNIRSKTEDNSLNYYINRCSGEIALDNINLKLHGDQRLFQHVQGNIYLRNNAVGIKNLSVKVNQTDLTLDGSLQNMSDYLLEKGPLKTDVHIQSHSIQLEDLATKPKEKTIQESRRYILPDDVLGSVYLNVAKITYDQQTFHNVEGNMHMDQHRVRLNALKFTNGGADIQGSLEIQEKSPEIFYISSKVVSKNIHFDKLFKEWDNFKQDVIQSTNIEGVAQANVSFSAPFDLRSGILSKSIVAQIGIQIDNGRLKDVAAFQQIIESTKNSSAKNIIGEENLDYFGGKLKDLTFNQLRNTFYIQDGMLTIPSMSIASSALDIEISGNHTFENKIDYRFGFRLKDLKKKEESEFGEIVDDGTGMSIFMRMYGELSDPKFEWDREARKANSKEKREAEKANVKSILKKEFGLYKNDTTVKDYIAPPKLEEEFDVKFDPVNEINEVIKETKPKKDSKLRRNLSKWKKEDEEDESSDDFELED